MKTYVAEINGEALIAFRTEGDNDAYHIVNETNGDLQLGLNCFRSGMHRRHPLVGWKNRNHGKAGDRQRGQDLARCARR
jgi:hypothetical protein